MSSSTGETKNIDFCFAAKMTKVPILDHYYYYYEHYCAVCQVMVWIHGGGLTIGAASQYDGAPLAAYENIVTVVIQYRLGILGFLR